jgi:phosphomannomutase/phosphoglucomutase
LKIPSKPRATADSTGGSANQPSGSGSAGGINLPGRGKSRPLLTYALATIAIGMLGLAIGAVLMHWLALAPNNARMLDLQRDALAQAYVEVINSRVHLLQQQASRIAASPNVQIAVAGRDGATIATLQQSLGNAIGSLRGVRIYPTGAATAEPQGTPPVNFSALDMVRAAERNEQPWPQAFRIGGELLVYAVAPIKGTGGKLIGTVLLISDPSYLEGALGAIENNVGTVRVEQKFSDSETVPLLEVGDQGTGQPLSRSTRVPHWSVVFDPSTAVVADSSVSLLSLLPAIAAAVLGLIAAAVLTYTRLRRNLLLDIDALRATLRSRRHGSDGYKLADIADFAGELSSIGQRRFESPPEPIPETPAPPRRAAKSTPPRAASAQREHDIEIPIELDDPLQVAPAAPPPAPSAPATGAAAARPGAPARHGIDPEVFRAYDIRGIVDRNLGEDVVYQIGRALGSEAAALNVKRLVVASDGRLSSPSLREAVIRGLRESGTDVTDLGEVPTPLLYFATHLLRTGSGVMITGSHNPPDYNGLKIVLAGETLAGERIQRLRQRIEQNEFTSGKGSLEKTDIVRRYIDRITEDVTVAQSLKVVVDCGNGIAGKVAPELLRALGCEVVELYCEVDGTFPNHHPDPAVPENLDDLAAAVTREKADLGIAFDGDGDRLGLVTESGRIIWPDRLMMLLARDVVGRNPGCDVVYDVKCSRHLSGIITDLGGRPIMWKTGHSNIKAKIKETGALLGGEFSGHICFLERWYGFDDALYTAARLLEIVGASHESLDETFAAFPDPFGTPEIRIATTEARKFEVVEALAAHGTFDNGTMNTIDGVRVDFSDGWGLVRASNTSPVLTLRFEADTGQALARISNLFQRELLRIDPALTFDFEAA